MVVLNDARRPSLEGDGRVQGNVFGLADESDRLSVIRRLLFVVFFCLGGFLFYVPKWILMGTKGSRDRKRLIDLAQEQNRLLRARQP